MASRGQIPLITLTDNVRATYPVRISWEGIRVDDPDHPLDIECCVHEIIEVIWKDRSIAIARGLERLCEVNAPDKKREGRKKKQTDAELYAFR